MSRGSTKYRDWYRCKRWRDRRALQLRQHPLCKMCEAEGRLEPATVVDHVVPHRGDRQLFFYGEVQSLCATCHDGAKRMVEERGYDTAIGADGFPKDRNHPFYLDRDLHVVQANVRGRSSLRGISFSSTTRRSERSS